MCKDCSSLDQIRREFLIFANFLIHMQILIKVERLKHRIKSLLRSKTPVSMDCILSYKN